MKAKNWSTWQPLLVAGYPQYIFIMKLVHEVHMKKKTKKIKKKSKLTGTQKLNQRFNFRLRHTVPAITKYKIT